MRDYAELLKWLRLSAKNCSMMDIDCANCAGDDCEGHERIIFLEAADAIEELLAELTTIRKQLPRWISVEERLPEINHPVLICAFGRSVGEGTYRGHDGVHRVWKMDAVAGTYWDDEVTHWMPLPTSPGGAE